MPTGSRIRRRMDVGRLREAMAGPGADPRCWVCFGRVDNEPDARRWDDVVGWIVDVTLVGGDLEGETVACRVARSYLNGGLGRIDPPQLDQLVMVNVPEGDPNVEPTIVGSLYSTQDPRISEINGQSVDQALAEAFHLFRTDLGVRWEVAGDLFLQVDGTTFLADHDADQSFIRGNDYADAEDTWLDAVDSLIIAINAAITLASATTAGGVVIDPGSLADYNDSAQQFRNARTQYLSSRIKGV